MGVILGGHYSAHHGDYIKNLEMGSLPWIVQVSPVGLQGSFQEEGKKVRQKNEAGDGSRGQSRLLWRRMSPGGPGRNAALPTPCVRLRRTRFGFLTLRTVRR